MSLFEKCIALFHSTGCATFSCNDCNQILPVVVDQYLTSPEAEKHPQTITLPH